jgi:phage terminase large subunit
MLERNYRVVVCYGARDTGKSYFVGGQYIPIKMLNDPYFRGVGIRNTYVSLKDSVYAEISDGFNVMDEAFNFKLGELIKKTKSPLEISVPHKKNKMLFRGLDDPLKLKSLKGINFIWVEEAEDLTERQFWDLLILLRGGNEENQQIVLTFNPTDEDHFSNAMFVESIADKVLMKFENGEKKVWVKKIKSEVEGETVEFEALCIRSTYEDNKFISPIRKAVIEQLKYSDPGLYDVYRWGLYGKKGGRILTNIEQRDFEAEGLIFNNFDNKGYGIDWGFNHASAILSVAEYDGCLYVFDEIYEYEKTNKELREIAEKKQLSKKIRMIGDSAEPSRIKEWEYEGWDISPVKKYEGSVKAQIDALKAYKKIYINTKCEMTWKEAKSWSWKQDKNGKYTDKPVDIFDDAMAALRYSTDLFDSYSVDSKFVPITQAIF